MKKIILILVCLFTVPSAFSADALDDLWSAYDELLQQHVKPGVVDGVEANLVDYQAIAASEELDKLVVGLAGVPDSAIESREGKLTYYINAYNILTLKLIADRMPKKSIRNIGNFIKGPWDIVMMERQGKDLTLDDIEHKILRPMGEPRIHFAINCASMGCPDLRLEAYRADQLDAQLEEQTKIFLGQGKGFSVQGGVTYLSPIFNWFGDDFDVRGGVHKFVSEYQPAATSNIKFIDYDWRLNRQ